MKSILRRAIEQSGLTLIRVALAARDAQKEEVFVKRTTQDLGLHRLKISELADVIAKPSATDFYVLGSGSSVENISAEEFTTISRAVSVGINAWPLHTFVPDIYCYEPVPEDDSDHFNTMKLLEREEILCKRPSVLFLKPRSENEIKQLSQIPMALRDRVMVYGRFTPFTRSTANLPGELASLLGLLGSRKLESVLPDSGASIVRMAALGLLLGFQRIIFIGVDLNHTNYFWQVNPKYLENLGLAKWESGQKGPVHETMSNTTRPFSVIETLTALAQVAPGLGGKLYAGSRTSELAKFLPLFDFGHESTSLNSA